MFVRRELMSSDFQMRIVAGISRQEEYRVSTKEMLCHMTF